MACTGTVTRSFAISKSSQTITFASISAKTLAQSPLALTATASSALTVTFTSTTPTVCTVTGTAAALLVAGSCTIVASQAGDAAYNAATNVSRTFNVTKASQTITFVSPGNRNYSSEPFAITATASSGLPVAFSSSTPVVCTVATNEGATLVTLLTAGTCTLAANQSGDSIYNAATQVTRSITISKASQVLTIAGMGTRNVGDAEFMPDTTNSAGLPVVVSSATTTVCTVANNAVTIVATGTCTIRANAPATATHNAATQVSRSATVSAARAIQVYYVHPDQIGSPRAITRPSDNRLMWKWDNEEAFGDNAANEDPTALGSNFKYNLRFAGQVHDRETGTNYNYFRDYEPEHGRYVQSDPIGLEGGINTYSYVRATPLQMIDPNGRNPVVLGLVGAAAAGYGAYSTLSTVNSCKKTCELTHGDSVKACEPERSEIVDAEKFRRVERCKAGCALTAVFENILPYNIPR